MSRSRLVVAATCLALLFLAALPGAALAQRNLRIDPAGAPSDLSGPGLARTATVWTHDALTWLQALISPEHGQIVPGVPPIPNDPPVPPVPPVDPEDPPTGDDPTP